MKYHAHMKFRVKDCDPGFEMVGEIVAVDFEFNEITIEIDGDDRVFRSSEVELVDHENCNAPECVAERNQR